MIATVGGMLESVKVYREDRLCQMDTVFWVEWRGLDGRICTDRKYVRLEHIYTWSDIPGVTVMLTPIFTQKNGRIAAMVYLMFDDEKKVVARIKKVPTQDPDEPFHLPGGLPLNGPDVYPLPIKEIKDDDDE